MTDLMTINYVCVALETETQYCHTWHVRLLTSESMMPTFHFLILFKIYLHILSHHCSVINLLTKLPNILIIFIFHHISCFHDEERRCLYYSLHIQLVKEWSWLCSVPSSTSKKTQRRSASSFQLAAGARKKLMLVRSKAVQHTRRSRFES